MQQCEKTPSGLGVSFRTMLICLFSPHSLVTYSNVPACKFAYEFYGNFTYIGKIAQFPALSNNVTTFIYLVRSCQSDK